jgi:hypothetical protein
MTKQYRNKNRYNQWGDRLLENMFITVTILPILKINGVMYNNLKYDYLEKEIHATAYSIGTQRVNCAKKQTDNDL